MKQAATYFITYKNSQMLLMAIILSSVFLLQVILLYGATQKFREFKQGAQTGCHMPFCC